MMADDTGPGFLKKSLDGVKGTLDKMWEGFGKSTSILVSSIFLIFTLGSIFGFFAALLPGNHSWLLMVPPLLGVLAFYFRNFALFLLFIFIFLVFI